jgi:cell division protease FtsH
VLSTVTTGSGNDIETATELARKMVCEWGMSNLGPLTFGKKREEIFLGREIAQRRDYSEETAKRIDSEVRRIVEEQQERATHIIKENLNSLHAIAKNLLEKEVLSGDDIDKILNKPKQVKKTTKRKVLQKG